MKTDNHFFLRLKHDPTMHSAEIQSSGLDIKENQLTSTDLLVDDFICYIVAL